MALIFLLAWRASLGGPSEYLNMVRKCVENFLQAFEKKFQPKKQDFWPKRVSKQAETSWQNPVFWVETLFQRLVKNYLRTFWPCSRYSEGPPRLALYANKKIRIIRRTNRIICQVKSKYLDFWRKWVSKRVETSCPNPLFWVETFFSRACRKFSTHFLTMFKVFRRCTQTSSLHQ